MSTITERLRERYFAGQPHPYQLLEHEVERRIRPDSTLLDAGCGRNAAVLIKLSAAVRTSIGIDMTGFTPQAGSEQVRLIHGDIQQIALRDESVDVAYSRSVLEHVQEPLKVYREIHRVLRPAGTFIFLTPNLWDYGSLGSKLIPNAWHPWIVNKLEGRKEHDTFPTYYRSNTRATIQRQATQAGFIVEAIRYVGQYPSYFIHNPVLFLIGTAYEKTIDKFAALNRLRGWLMVVLTKPTHPRHTYTTAALLKGM